MEFLDMAFYGPSYAYWKLKWVAIEFEWKHD